MRAELATRAPNPDFSDSRRVSPEVASDKSRSDNQSLKPQKQSRADFKPRQQPPDETPPGASPRQSQPWPQIRPSQLDTSYNQKTHRLHQSRSDRGSTEGTRRCASKQPECCECQRFILLLLLITHYYY